MEEDGRRRREGKGKVEGCGRGDRGKAGMGRREERVKEEKRGRGERGKA